MSLDVTQGSIVAVDPDELRMLATRVDNAAYHASSAMAQIAYADALQRDYPIHELRDMWPCTYGMLDECRAVYDDAKTLADGLRLAAETYEQIELRTQYEMAGPERRNVIANTWNHRMLLFPQGDGMARHLWYAWEGLTGAPLAENWGGSSLHAGAIMAVFVSQLAKMRRNTGLGRGSLGESRRAQQRAGRVPGTSDRYVPMARQSLGTTKAPASLGAAISRIPSSESTELSEDARVRVEKYAMPSGDEKFVVYISGSREKPWQDDDPFSWANNVGLYTGELDSEGYDFVLEALERSGASAGSAVDINAFSQGAMVGQRLATDSDFDVQRVTTIGAPLRIPMGDGVTSLTLAHDDDPVAALSDGGSPMRLGNDDSLLITRAFDETTDGLEKWKIGAHRVSAYAETARIFEESGDPRGADVRAYYDELSRAKLLESYSYEAPGPEFHKIIGGASSEGEE